MRLEFLNFTLYRGHGVFSTDWWLEVLTFDNDMDSASLLLVGRNERQWEIDILWLSVVARWRENRAQPDKRRIG